MKYNGGKSERYVVFQMQHRNTKNIAEECTTIISENSNTNVNFLPYADLLKIIVIQCEKNRQIHGLLLKHIKILFKTNGF